MNIVDNNPNDLRVGDEIALLPEFFIMGKDGKTATILDFGESGKMILEWSDGEKTIESPEEFEKL